MSSANDAQDISANAVKTINPKSHKNEKHIMNKSFRVRFFQYSHTLTSQFVAVSIPVSSSSGKYLYPTSTSEFPAGITVK